MPTIFLHHFTSKIEKVQDASSSAPSFHALNRHNLLPEHQSAYLQHHSTETALLRVLSDLLSASGAGQMLLPVLLDLSVAFGHCRS